MCLFDLQAGPVCTTYKTFHFSDKKKPLNMFMAESSKFRATLNLGYFFLFLSMSHSWEVLELLFSAELKTTYLHFNMVYKMYLNYNSK